MQRRPFLHSALALSAMSTKAAAAPAAMAAYKSLPGMEGATYYYFGIPKNPVNEALVSAHYKQLSLIHI